MTMIRDRERSGRRGVTPPRRRRTPRVLLAVATACVTITVSITGAGAGAGTVGATAAVPASASATSTVNTASATVTPGQFGARGDGHTDDTAALQRCFDHAGGRAVVLPAGRVYARRAP